MNTTKALMVINGVEILEDGSERFNLKNLQRAADAMHRTSRNPAIYARLDSTKDLVEEILRTSSIGDNPHPSESTPIYAKIGTGRHGGGTYAVEILAVDYAMWISPAFKIVVIEAFLNRKKNIDPFHAQEKPIMTTQIVPSTNPYSDLMNKVDTILEFGVKLNFSPEVALQEARRVVTEATGWFALEAKQIPFLAGRAFFTPTEIGERLGGRTAQDINRVLADLRLQVRTGITNDAWAPTLDGEPYCEHRVDQKNGIPYGHLVWELKELEELLEA